MCIEKRSGYYLNNGNFKKKEHASLRDNVQH